MNKVRIYVTLEELFGEGGFDATNVQNAVNEIAQSKQTFDAKFVSVINILADRYYNWYCGYVDKWFIPGEEIQLSEDDYLEIANRFIRNFMIIYNFTEKKYLTLLGLYTAQEANLMNQLNSVESITGSRRVNDTPQDAGTGNSNFEDDDHTSLWEGNESTRTVNSDPTTVMERLDQIQRMYMHLIKGWCDEFAKLFITPAREFKIQEEEDDG